MDQHHSSTPNPPVWAAKFLHTLLWAISINLGRGSYTIYRTTITEILSDNATGATETAKGNIAQLLQEGGMHGKRDITIHFHNELARSLNRGTSINDLPILQYSRPTTTQEKGIWMSICMHSLGFSTFQELFEHKWTVMKEAGVELRKRLESQGGSEMTDSIDLDSDVGQLEIDGQGGDQMRGLVSGFGSMILHD
ncbi:hypothetical protein BU23DRAFT_559180, partial [Bimuria novae-zelandiae CBS 107.79]